MIKMCRDGKDPAKKLLDKSISEFQTTMRNSKDERALAMISDESAAKVISTLLREQFPEDASLWQQCAIQDGLTICFKLFVFVLFSWGLDTWGLGGRDWGLGLGLGTFNLMLLILILATWFNTF